MSRKPGFNEDNPQLEEIREKGWCFIQRSKVTGEYGAPYIDHRYAEVTEKERPDDQEVLILGLD